MTLVELQTLIADSKGEWEHIEFKKTTGELQGGMVTLCGFLNGSGGKVLFGVTNAGKIQGQDTTDATFQDVANAIRKLEPPVWIEQIRIPVSGTREVLMLETTLRTDGPYTFDGRPYLRIGNTTSRMPQVEYQRRLLARSMTQHRWEDESAEGYVLDDLDTAEIERMLDAAVQCGRLERKPASLAEALDKLKLRVQDRLVRAAVVLFAREVLPDFPQCGLRMARFRGTSKLGDFLDQRQLYGHAFRLLEEAELFLRRHIPIAGTFAPDKWERQDRPAYPFLALREALVNALCHRDYSIVGGAVHVAIFDDRLEIISTGLLPPGITVADLKRDHASIPRNPTVAEVLFRCGLIERWGRGTQKIVELCEASGYPPPDFDEQAGSVVVRFPSGGYVAPTHVGHDLTGRQQRILHILADGRKRRLQEIHGSLESPPAKRTLLDDLQLLRQLGLIASGGKGVGARWWLVLQGVP
jgi:ATP-dependent DNA helicase RecG